MRIRKTEDLGNDAFKAASNNTVGNHILLFV